MIVMTLCVKVRKLTQETHYLCPVEIVAALAKKLFLKKFFWRCISMAEVFCRENVSDLDQQL